MAINPRSFDERELLEFLGNELPRLIVKRPEIRYEIIGIASDQFVEKGEFAKILSEIKSLREDSLALREDFKADCAAWRAEMKTLREDSDAKMESMRKDSQALREDFKADCAAWRAEMKTLREDFNAEMKSMRENFDLEMKSMRREFQEDMKVLQKETNNKISAIGARWGINSERSFRDGLKGILKDLRGIEVEHFIGLDKGGFVFGRPDQVELDVVVKDGVVILVEIKSSMSRSDVITFQRKIEWYEKEHDVKVDRKVIISPLIDLRAIDEIDYHGMDMYSGSDVNI